MTNEHREPTIKFEEGVVALAQTIEDIRSNVSHARKYSRFVLLTIKDVERLLKEFEEPKDD